ncbi:hypothetical protein [Rummeliibacillus sp. SL167]|uniref:hypothetical protein n=1 Tax=Rummeliibacillus sp. SL167 TaxID=2579792 RepID=UPI0011B6432C|nr:hypothetical protein [Rummeliibacillus sp. SL167]
MINFLFSNDSKTAKFIAIISGLFAFIVGLYVSYDDFFNHTVSTGVFLMAIGIMQLCNYFLIPHMSLKDERAKLIKEKSMNISYYFYLGVMLLVLLLIDNPFFDFDLSVRETLLLLISVYIIFIHLTMVYFSKKV